MPIVHTTIFLAHVTYSVHIEKKTHSSKLFIVELNFVLHIVSDCITTFIMSHLCIQLSIKYIESESNRRFIQSLYSNAFTFRKCWASDRYPAKNIVEFKRTNCALVVHRSKPTYNVSWCSNTHNTYSVFYSFPSKYEHRPRLVWCVYNSQTIRLNATISFAGYLSLAHCLLFHTNKRVIS